MTAYDKIREMAFIAKSKLEGIVPKEVYGTRVNIDGSGVDIRNLGELTPLIEEIGITDISLSQEKVLVIFDEKIMIVNEFGKVYDEEDIAEDSPSGDLFYVRKGPGRRDISFFESDSGSGAIGIMVSVR